jgi:predicted lipid-binding transport protein (Tim44 family)
VKGRPILGAITGFLFGFFLGITLFLYGVIPLSSDMLWILPLLGILLGLIMAAWAPFGMSAEPAPAPASAPAPVAATSEEASTDATEDDASDEEKAAGDESAANEEATAEPTAE